MVALTGLHVPVVGKVGEGVIVGVRDGVKVGVRVGVSTVPKLVGVQVGAWLGSGKLALALLLVSLLSAIRFVESAVAVTLIDAEIVIDVD